MKQNKLIPLDLSQNSCLIYVTRVGLTEEANTKATGPLCQRQGWKVVLHYRNKPPSSYRLQTSKEHATNQHRRFINNRLSKWFLIRLGSAQKNKIKVVSMMCPYYWNRAWQVFNLKSIGKWLDSELTTMPTQRNYGGGQEMVDWLSSDFWLPEMLAKSASPNASQFHCSLEVRSTSTLGQRNESNVRFHVHYYTHNSLWFCFNYFTGVVATRNCL